MIAILEANIGNLRSVFNAVYTMGYDAEIVSHVEISEKHSHLIIPGVGSFKGVIKNGKMLTKALLPQIILTLYFQRRKRKIFFTVISLIQMRKENCTKNIEKNGGNEL